MSRYLLPYKKENDVGVVSLRGQQELVNFPSYDITNEVPKI